LSSLYFEPCMPISEHKNLKKKILFTIIQVKTVCCIPHQTAQGARDFPNYAAQSSAHGWITHGNSHTNKTKAWC